MIACAIATFRREDLLRRLLESLRKCPALADGELYIVDNASDNLRPLAESTGWKDAHIIDPGQNLGCAGGVALALSTALQNSRVRQLLILDDDAFVEPDAPGILRDFLETSGAGLAAPMVTNEDGEIGWFPGIQDEQKWRVLKRPHLRPEDYIRECGDEPVRFTWSAWPVLMASREAVETCGLPLQSLWYQGVDLEFTLRVTHRLEGYFVPEARAAHYPPAIVYDRRFFFRECGGLQNSFFVFCRLAHGRRALRHLPGNVWRFFRIWGMSPRVIANVLRAFWWGGVRAKPQGSPGFGYFREQWQRAAQ